MNIHKLTLAALLVAIGTLSAHLIYIPAGASWAILNSKAAAWFFVPPFLISTMGGSIIAGLLIKSGILTHLMPASFSGRAGK